MKSVLAALRTLAVLVLCLAAVGVVGFLIGELPPRDAVERRRAIAAREAQEARDAEARRQAEERARTPSPVDAGVAEVAPPEPPKIPRLRACDDSRDATLARVRLDARGRELVALACGDALEILGFVGETPIGVARLAPAAVDQSAPVRAFHIASDDFTGDGAIDWVVGTLRSVDATSPSVGTLHVVPGDTRGGLGEPIAIAPLAVAGLDLGRIDDDETTDVVVLHRPDPTAARAPEAWAFRGGASPVRIGRVPLGRGATVVALADVDADGFADLIPSGRDASGLAILAGDGHGTFARRVELAIPATERLLRFSQPPAGARVVFAGAVPSQLVASTTGPSIAGLAIPPNPIAADLRVDGHAIPLVVLEGGVARVLDLGTTPPSAIHAYSVASEQGRIVGVVLGDLAGAAAPDLVLLVERAGATRERDLVVRLDVGASPTPGEVETLLLATERTSIANGPLHLTIPLR